MRPNAVGWGILAFFAIAGAAVWVMRPDVYLGQGWVACAALMAVIYLWMIRRADRKDEVIRSGVRGEATIVSAEQTGLYVNNQPRVKLHLRVRTPYSEFQDERTETVPLISVGMLSSGRPLAVYVDPDEPSKYEIDWSSY